MLHNISWSTFIWMLIPILVFYYLFVISVYFLKDFLALLHGNRSLFNGQAINKNLKIHPTQESTQVSSNNLIYELIEDLKKTFTAASRTHMVKEELIQAIRSNIKRYPAIGQTGLLEDINTHISQEAKENCKMELLPADLRMIWSS
jgi:hypothetical protein